MQIERFLPLSVVILALTAACAPLPRSSAPAPDATHGAVAYEIHNRTSCTSHVSLHVNGRQDRSLGTVSGGARQVIHVLPPAGSQRYGVDALPLEADGRACQNDAGSFRQVSVRRVAS